MLKLGKALRLIALSLLSGGSTAITFAAIVLVKSAEAHGVPTAEAAANNAPAFIHYSKVALGAAILLAVSEGIIFSQLKGQAVDNCRKFAMFASIACILCVCGFAFGIVPPMEKLLPDIKTVEAAHAQFTQLHNMSRAVFGSSILLAFISMILPVFSKEQKTLLATPPESKVLI